LIVEETIAATKAAQAAAKENLEAVKQAHETAKA
jgi:hypothetical protein